MVVAEVYKNITVYGGLTLESGHLYVMASGVLYQLKQIYPGFIEETMKFEEIYRPLDLSKLERGDSIFMFRSGGIGDIMFMLPLIQFLKENYEINMTVATSPMYCSVLENNPHIDKIIEVPFSVEAIMLCTWHLMFEGVIEGDSSDARVIHAVDLFLGHAGIDYKHFDPEFKVPRIYLSDDEVTKMSKNFSRWRHDKNAFKIGIQLEASSPIRTFPFEKTISLIRKLLGVGYCVFIFGGKKQERIGGHLSVLFGAERNFINLIMKQYSLRESIVLASLMDAMVAPDSAFIHIAGALDIPIVGLYGCFPSVLRMKYYKHSVGIDCNVSCAPGFKHGHASCAKGDPSPCFSVIQVSDIMNAIDHLLGKKKIQFTYPKFNLFARGELVESSFNFI